MNDRDHTTRLRLESIEARLTRHHRTTRLSLMLLSTIGVVALALLGYIITRL
ncbi:hypothetical protein KHP60_12665 [Microvirga sp. 3-52]|jgi:hypothetical protein|uniref:hypothetical protein n=1 Tax=Microvirga sp. 3-52 TaxID=2792425 RepID=UPI001AD5BDA6|nr:hypothetical protein [Microvirga sp. 3-52]MBO1905919.1 hypothetical protein [Microvirga sp. 3-52]MBS7453185.1 hypothetical protein [Microvirga sp. 3-52]